MSKKHTSIRNDSVNVAMLLANLLRKSIVSFLVCCNVLHELDAAWVFRSYLDELSRAGRISTTSVDDSGGVLRSNLSNEC